MRPARPLPVLRESLEHRHPHASTRPRRAGCRDPGCARRPTAPGGPPPCRPTCLLGAPGVPQVVTEHVCVEQHGNQGTCAGHGAPSRGRAATAEAQSSRAASGSDGYAGRASLAPSCGATRTLAQAREARHKRVGASGREEARGKLGLAGARMPRAQHPPGRPASGRPAFAMCVKR